MNQFEQFREQCVQACEDLNERWEDGETVRPSDCADAIRALPLPEATQEQIAWLCHDLDGHAGVGFSKQEAKRRASEFCNEYDPLYLLPPDAEALRKENEILSAKLDNLKNIISSNAYVISFQSIGQYRNALLKEINK